MWKTRWKMMAVLVSWFGAQQGVALAQHQHHDDDVIVGRTGDGRLALEFDFGESIQLPAVQGLLNGFALDDPGFLSLAVDEPGEDFFILADGASIALEVVSFSPALSAWTPGFLARLGKPGDRWLLGGASFDEHITWHVDADHPSFDPAAGPWTATFRLLDLGSTGYAVSPDYTVTFVPEPGLLTLMSIGALSLWRRRPTRGENLVLSAGE